MFWFGSERNSCVASVGAKREGSSVFVLNFGGDILCSELHVKETHKFSRILLCYMQLYLIIVMVNFVYIAIFTTYFLYEGRK